MQEVETSEIVGRVDVTRFPPDDNRWGVYSNLDQIKTIANTRWNKLRYVNWQREAEKVGYGVAGGVGGAAVWEMAKLFPVMGEKIQEPLTMTVLGVVAVGLGVANVVATKHRIGLQKEFVRHIHHIRNEIIYEGKEEEKRNILETVDSLKSDNLDHDRMESVRQIFLTEPGVRQILITSGALEVDGGNDNSIQELIDHGYMRQGHLRTPEAWANMSPRARNARLEEVVKNARKIHDSNRRRSR